MKNCDLYYSVILGLSNDGEMTFQKNSFKHFKRQNWRREKKTAANVMFAIPIYSENTNHKNF